MSFKNEPYYGNNDEQIKMLIERIKAREERNKRVTRAQWIVAILAVVMLLTGMAIQRNNKREYIEDTVVVHKSTGTDTLWGIADRYCPDDMDKRTYIEYIKQDNNCTDLIRSGDVLTIRRYEK